METEAIETGTKVLQWVNDYGMLQVCAVGFIAHLFFDIWYAIKKSGTEHLQAAAQETLVDEYKELNEKVDGICQEMAISKAVKGAIKQQEGE